MKDEATAVMNLWHVETEFKVCMTSREHGEAASTLLIDQATGFLFFLPLLICYCIHSVKSWRRCCLSWMMAGWQSTFCWCMDCCCCKVFDASCFAFLSCQSVEQAVPTRWPILRIIMSMLWRCKRSIHAYMFAMKQCKHFKQAMNRRRKYVV